MGIYLPNMEMPQNCGECLFKHLSPTGESLVCDISLSTVSWNERPFDCPLVEIPPHGDLMDRDDFFAVCPELVDGYKRITDDLVIIPAEEGET